MRHPGGRTLPRRPWSLVEASKALVRALRTGIADRIEHIVDLRDGLIGGDAVRRIATRKRDRTITSVRVGTIPGPAMLLAFANRAGLLQHMDGPSAQCLDRRPSFPDHQHARSLLRDESVRPPNRSAR
nr:hypothetical protein BDOA9_0100920 [Bradyrhizobium sp. DOA9]